MIKSLIFDLDGTLVNTEMLHYRAWKEALHLNGVALFNFETFLKYVGTSNEKVASDFIASDGIEKSVLELINVKQVIYKDLIPEIQLCDGVREVLERFQGRLKLAVASSSYENEVMAILKLQDIADYFKVIVGGDMVKMKKPDPEIYLKTKDLLGVTVEECVAFEDSTHGLNAAKNAGMFGIAIPNEFTRDHDFSRGDRTLGSLAEVDTELLRVLESDYR